MRTQPDAAATPTQWVMRYVVRAFGATLLDNAGGMASLLVGTGMLLILALGAGWFGYPVVGLVLAGLAGILWTIRAMIGRIGPGPDGGPGATVAFELAQDAALVALLTWGRAPLAGETLLDQVFPALALLLLLRLVAGLAPPRWRGWLADRTVLALALGAAMALNASGIAVQIAILACAGLGILFLRDKTRLTQL